MSTYNKYANIFSQRKNQLISTNKKSNNQLNTMADRNAYMTFLEVQLDRVTSACMTVEGFSKRLEDQNSLIISQEERIANLSRLNTLQQTYINSQEEEITKIKGQLKFIEGKFNDNISKNPAIDREKLAFNKISEIESKLISINEKLSNINLSDIQKSLTIPPENKDKELAELEIRIMVL